jgi:NADH:ubiquinone oxidoreductase subunit 2 (subunit N)
MFKSLNEFKYLGSLFYFTGSLILILLSIAGMPPLLGFVSKFLIFIFLLFKGQFLIFLVFSILSLFSIYFYIQNIRFVISKEVRNIFILKNNFVFFNFNIIALTIFLNFFNMFGIFFFDDFLIFINFMFSFICLG